MKILQKYSQRDPRWINQRLGTVNGTTIGGEGCYDTSFTMVAGYYGHIITPADFDNACTNKFYIDGNEATDDMLQKVFPDCKYVTSYNFYEIAADLALLKKLLDDPTLMVIIEVDFDHNPNDGIQTHFMVVVDSDGGKGIKVADPWQLPASIDDFSKNYGDNPAQTILKYVVYKGTPINQGGDSNMADMYRGYDAANPESMRAIIDGYFNRGTEIDQLKTQVAELSKRPESCPPAGDPKAQAKLTQISDVVKADPMVKISNILNS